MAPPSTAKLWPWTATKAEGAFCREARHCTVEMNRSADVQRWFQIFEPRATAQHRLICLPHAGGTARFFSSLASLLPRSIELVAVQYPGRESRLDDPLPKTMTGLSEACSAAVAELYSGDAVPLSLFGHSMGAAVAYEVCRTLSRWSTALPRMLVVSACPGPSRHKGGTFHLASDDRLLAEVDRLGAASGRLADHPELARMVLPAIRGDYRIMENWRPTVRDMLSIPVTAFVGRDDEEATEEEARAWALETTAGLALRTFSGGHFYLIPECVAVAHAIAEALGDG